MAIYITQGRFTEQAMKGMTGTSLILLRDLHAPS